MKKACVLALLWSAGISGSASAQTADEIIAKNLAARGGIERLRAIRSMVMTESASTPDGKGAPLKLLMLRPDRIREELAVGPGRSIKAFDGQSGWTQNPGPRGTTVRPLTGGDLQELRDDAENAIDGVLADYASKGSRVELAGTQTVDGRQCYKLKVTLHTGHTQYQYIDTRTYLEVRQDLLGTTDGKPSAIEQTLSDYRSEGGVLFPHTIVSVIRGQPGRSTVTIQRIEINPPMDEKIFSMPRR
ncbi:MAG TPA: hypothetical protein VEG63_13840 [Candidatus Acidoferrales bacterium]|nr:hypothetical protein [Candidatus Acidoferrales bacterium]